MVATVVVLSLSACAGPVGLREAVEQTLDAGPGRDSATYRAPDPLEAHELAGALLAVLSGTEDVSAPAGTAVQEAVDADGRTVRLLTEDLESGTVRGLGVYAARPGVGAPAGLVVEVPHPRADRRTEQLGSQLFTALSADALLVAGAHRTAGEGTADVAHRPDSAFAAVDRAVVGPGTVVLQVHGFDESRHEGSAEVVLSSARAPAGPLVEELAEALEGTGFDTCVYDGKRCAALAGSRNVQAAHARGVGAVFVHLELASTLREEGVDRARLVEVLERVLAR
ncbi:hypothetical protein [Modestobacter sp. URMC 112]